MNSTNKKIKKAKVIVFKHKISLGITTQLLIGFIIPILFIVMVGMISYMKASSGMMKTYKDTATEALQVTKQYLDLGLKNVKADALQLANDENTMSYTTNEYKDDVMQKMNVTEAIENLLITKVVSNTFSAGIHIVGNENTKIISTAKLDSAEGIYDVLLNGDDETNLIPKNTMNGWISSHAKLDELFNQNQGSYGLCFVQKLNAQNACVIVDVDRNKIVSSLEKLNFGTGCLVGLITPDGNEIIINEKEQEDFKFGGQPFFQVSDNEEEDTSIRNVKYNNMEYMFLNCKSIENGYYLCVMIPQALANSNAESIKNFTYMAVAIASVVVLFIAIFIIRGITKNIKIISKQLATVAKGDLTTKIYIDSKNEFGKLAVDVEASVNNTRNLIQKVDNVVALVTKATEAVNESSYAMEKHSNHISGAVEEIDNGITHQAEESQKCLMQMDELSTKITVVGENVVKIEEITDSTKKIISDGISIMGELSEHSVSTTRITKKVVEDIQVLGEKSNLIEQFIGIIEEISSQTSLLSINASIEAARAGAAGLGFAVVAEEINKLAEGSKNAAKKIHNVVEEIRIQTSNTVAVAKQSEKVVASQSTSVKKAIDAYSSMGERVENLLLYLDKVNESVCNMDKDRKETLLSIESISSASEETAAASNEVFNVVNEQKVYVEQLNQSSKELRVRIAELNEAVHLFKI